ANTQPGMGFLWEVEQIVELGLRSRAIVVLPPGDRRQGGDQTALREARAIVGQLSSETRGLSLVNDLTDLTPDVPDDALVVVPCPLGVGPKCWVPAARRSRVRRRKRRMLISSWTYETSLVPAIHDVEAAMADLSFEERYPVSDPS